MRGVDCTPEQIAHARKFFESSARRTIDRDVTLKPDDLFRIIAWYGALRYIAGRDGEGGTLERPGPLGGFSYQPAAPPVARTGDAEGERAQKGGE